MTKQEITEKYQKKIQEYKDAKQRDLSQSYKPHPLYYDQYIETFEEFISELASLESEQEDTILVDDPHYPNLGKTIKRKDYEKQFESEPEGYKSAEKFIDEKIKNIHLPVYGKEDLIQWLIEYVSQSRPKPTDNEIEEWVDKKMDIEMLYNCSRSRLLDTFRETLIHFAKTMRDNPEQFKSKEK